MKKSKKILIAFLVLLLGPLFWAGYHFFLANDVVYIGLVGPMSGKGEGYGASMRQSMRLLVNETNKNGGVDGKKIKLIIKDDENNKTLAKKRAEEFVKENKVSIIIGHYYSSANLAAQDIYKNAGIPNITPSATNVKVTTQSKWMFRTTFNDDFQGKFLANFAHDILGANNVVVIYDTDPFGNGLRRAFLNGSRKIGLKELASLGFDNRKSEYAFINDPVLQRADVIFFAVHAPEAAVIIPLVRKTGTKAKLLGPDSLGSQAFSKKVGSAGEGIYAAMPLLFDVAGEKAQVFLNKYKKRYGHEPDWQAAYTYDAGLLAIEAIKKAGTNRAEIRKVLANINSRKKSIQGVTGKNYFDENGDMMKPPAIGRLTNGEFISTLTQVQTPDIKLNKTELHKLRKNKQILLVDGIPFFRTNVVYTGIDVIDIPYFDDKNQTYTIDFYLWMRWKGKLKPTNYEFMNGSLSAEPVLVNEKHDGDSHYIVQKLRGTFKGNFKLHNYPFDSQILRISLRHKSLSRRFLIYVPDKQGLSEQIPKLTTSTWKPKALWQYSGVQLSESSLGDPRNITSKITIARATYNYALVAQRVVLPALLKLLIPLSLIVVVCFIQVFLSPDETEARVGVGVTTLLSAIAFHISQTSHMPNVGYLITADKFFFVSYAEIALSIFVTTVVHILYRKDRPDLSHKVDLYARFFLPISFVSAVAILMIWN